MVLGEDFSFPRYSAYSLRDCHWSKPSENNEEEYMPNYHVWYLTLNVNKTLAFLQKPAPKETVANYVMHNISGFRFKKHIDISYCIVISGHWHGTWISVSSVPDLYIGLGK